MSVNIDTIITDLKENAQSRHVSHPQYKGHWDDWGLAQVKKTIRLRLGDIPAGSYVLVDQGLHKPAAGKKVNSTFAVIHNPVSGVDTSVEFKYLAVLIAPTKSSRKLSLVDIDAGIIE